MPSTKAIIQGAALSAGGMLTLTLVVLWQLRTGDAAQLQRVRAEVRSMFSAKDSLVRVAHARESVRLAKPLATKAGRTGATAAVFLIGSSPVAKMNLSGVLFPTREQLQLVATEDLLLGSRLLFNVHRLGIADELVGILLSCNDGDREEILRLAITVRYELGRDDDVLAHCDEVLAKHADDAGMYHVKAMIHRNHGRWDHFADAAERGIELQRQSGGAPEIDLVELLDAYLQLGRTSDARRQFDALSLRKSELISAQSTLHARLLIHEGHHVEAAEVLRSVLTQHPDDGEALALQGALLVGQQKYDEAIAALEAAVKVAPTCEQAHYHLGQAYARRGAPDLARESLEKHRQLLDAKVQLHQLEQQASREPRNVQIRRELAERYTKIGLPALANFWTRAARASAE
ncbi:MAG: tetratricopeptide repeat protein [Planctomycetaceae bacterium]|nr:tetratricopeptide repeat protein [Planctomycetaceae bacterium]